MENGGGWTTKRAAALLKIPRPIFEQTESGVGGASAQAWEKTLDALAKEAGVEE